MIMWKILKFKFLIYLIKKINFSRTIIYKIIKFLIKIMSGNKKLINQIILINWVVKKILMNIFLKNIKFYKNKFHKILNKNKKKLYFMMFFVQNAMKI